MTEAEMDDSSLQNSELSSCELCEKYHNERGTELDCSKCYKLEIDANNAAQHQQQEVKDVANAQVKHEEFLSSIPIKKTISNAVYGSYGCLYARCK